MSFSINTFGDPIDMPREGATFFREFTNSLVTASSLRNKAIKIKYKSIEKLPIAEHDGPLLTVAHTEAVPFPEGSPPVGIVELVGGFA